MLGHGAGGGVGSPDLVAAKDAALEAGVSVVLVEQPYRVAGRRSPAPAHQLDTAWTTVLAQLREGVLHDLPLICGGLVPGTHSLRSTSAISAAVSDWLGSGVLALDKVH